MKRFAIAGILAAAFLLSSAAAQTTAPQIDNVAKPQAFYDGSGNRRVVSPTDPLPVNAGQSVAATGLAASQTTVGTSAAVVRASGSFVHSEIRNTGAAAIYLGPSGVTTSSGFRVLPGESYDASRYAGDIYAIAGTLQTVDRISY